MKQERVIPDAPLHHDNITRLTAANPLMDDGDDRLHRSFETWHFLAITRWYNTGGALFLERRDRDTTLSTNVEIPQRQHGDSTGEMLFPSMSHAGRGETLLHGSLVPRNVFIAINKQFWLSS